MSTLREVIGNAYGLAARAAAALEGDGDTVATKKKLEQLYLLLKPLFEDTPPASSDNPSPGSTEERRHIYSTGVHLETSKSGWNGEHNLVMVTVDVELPLGTPQKKVDAHAQMILGEVLTKLCRKETQR